MMVTCHRLSDACWPAPCGRRTAGVKGMLWKAAGTQLMIPASDKGVVVCHTQPHQFFRRGEGSVCRYVHVGHVSGGCGFEMGRRVRTSCYSDPLNTMRTLIADTNTHSAIWPAHTWTQQGKQVLSAQCVLPCLVMLAGASSISCLHLNT